MARKKDEVFFDNPPEVPRIRSAYDGSRVRVCAEVGGESLTKQSFANECDINVILARFAKGGALTHLNKRSGVFADVSGVGGFQDAMATVKRGQELFAALPAKVRAKFKGDVAAFIDFCLKPENQAEGAALGLWPARKEPERAPEKKEAPPAGGAS